MNILVLTSLWFLMDLKYPGKIISISLIFASSFIQLQNAERPQFAMALVGVQLRVVSFKRKFIFRAWGIFLFHRVQYVT
jgi:hypothetical protein